MPPSTGNETLLRVRAALPARDLDLSTRVASILRAEGFRVDDVTPRGVGFAGTPDRIERVFDCTIEPRGGGYAFARRPRPPEPFHASDVSIYLPTPPDYHR